ncbi:MAG: hypothetical protein AABZ58_12300 [Chloroflexota bacterium]
MSVSQPEYTTKIPRMSGILVDERKTSADELPEQQADLVWVVRLSWVGDDAHYSAHAPQQRQRQPATRGAPEQRVAVGDAEEESAFRPAQGQAPSRSLHHA